MVNLQNRETHNRVADEQSLGSFLAGFVPQDAPAP